MSVFNIKVLLKNTTGSPIVIGSITVPASNGTVLIWDTVDYNPVADTNFVQVWNNPAIFNQRIGNGNFVLVLNGVDQTAQQSFDLFFDLKNSYIANQNSPSNIEPNKIEVRLDSMGEPNGFPNRTDSQYSINNGTRTFTIQPVSASYDVWIRGVKYTKTSAESVVWSTTEGLHVLYFNTSGVLSDTTSITAIEDIILGQGIIVAAIYWDATNSQAILLTEERHGIVMDSRTHYYLHTTQGSKWISGGSLFNFVPNGGGTLNSQTQFSVENVKFADEDIEFDTSLSSQVLSPIAQIPVFYLNGTALAPVWRKKTADAFPCLYSGSGGYTGANGRLAWNQFNGSNWVLTEVDELDYVLMHYYACNDVNTPIIGVLGQNEYASVEAARRGARAEAYSLANILLLLSKELVLLGTVIFSTSSTYSNTAKAAIVSTDLGTDYLDNRPRGVPDPSEFETQAYKTWVRVATTANITLSGTQTIDGVALQVGNRVLVKDQSNPVNNGIYVVQPGTWVRANDFNVDADVFNGAVIYVRSGTLNADTLWSLTTDPPITLGVTSISFSAIGVATTNPSDIGVTAQGTSNKWARQDHVHAHGNQTGGSLHSTVSNTAAGFAPSVGASGTALISTGTAATWQTIASVTSTAPVNVTKAAAVVGVSTEAARADHKHDITTAAAVALAIDSTNTEGTSTSIARADHTHAITAGTPVALTVGGSNSAGVATTFTRSDHTHSLPAFGTTSGTFAQGNDSRFTDDRTASGLRTATTVVAISAATAPTTGQALVATSSTAATWQTVSNFSLASTTPANVDKSTAAVGVGTTAARADHKHDISTAAAVALSVGGSNAEGTATTLARSDHTHSLPAFGTTAGTIAQGNDSRFTDDRTASGLRTATTVVAISSATAPTTGQALVATSSTAATWQTVSTIPNTRTITAGAGLTGGGDLSADRTINVGANVDGSIVVNADDIQVGILATDAQHGSRGGGTLHAAVTNAAAGFVPLVGASGTILNSTGTAAQWSTSATLNLVTGPASSTDLAIPRFNGTTGKIIQNSGITINSTNQMSGVVTAGFASEFNAGNSSTAATINWNNGQRQVLTLTGSPAVLTFTAPTTGVGNFMLRIVQDATGGRTITWPASVRWPGGTAPTINTAAATVHIVSFYYNGTLYYGVGSLSFA